jgi:hypothetical protein
LIAVSTISAPSTTIVQAIALTLPKKNPPSMRKAGVDIDGRHQER